MKNKETPIQRLLKAATAWDDKKNSKEEPLTFTIKNKHSKKLTAQLFGSTNGLSPISNIPNVLNIDKIEISAEEGPRIDPDLQIKFKGASKEQKNKIRDILIANYTDMVNKMVETASYATTTSYWENYYPIGGTKITAGEFIKKYGK